MGVCPNENEYFVDQIFQNIIDIGGSLMLVLSSWIWSFQTLNIYLVLIQILNRPGKEGSTGHLSPKLWAPCFSFQNKVILG